VELSPPPPGQDRTSAIVTDRGRERYGDRGRDLEEDWRNNTKYHCKLNTRNLPPTTQNVLAVFMAKTVRKSGGLLIHHLR
jgi:hypothetical protein